MPYEETFTDIETISNPLRGCGHLVPKGLYLRSDLNPQGTLPSIVTYDEPIPYFESHFRGFRIINGLALDITLDKDTIPPRDIDHLINRLRSEPEYLAADVARVQGAWSADLLMWIGEIFYPTSESFIKEVRRHGLNKRIRTSQTVPVVVPGLTRVYLMHPKAIAESEPGMIGYCYLTRVIWTRPVNQNTPKWIEELHKLGRLTVVDIGAPEGERDRVQGPLDGLVNQMQNGFVPTGDSENFPEDD